MSAAVADGEAPDPSHAPLQEIVLEQWLSRKAQRLDVAAAATPLTVTQASALGGHGLVEIRAQTEGQAARYALQAQAAAAGAEPPHAPLETSAAAAAPAAPTPQTAPACDHPRRAKAVAAVAAAAAAARADTVAAAADTAAIDAALQEADVHRACISANLAAAGLDGTITLVPHNSKDGEGRIAYFWTRAEAVAFITNNHGTFGGVPPCLDTVRAAALNKLYEGVNPMQLLLDAHHGGYAIATRSAVRSDGSCSPEVVLDLRLELRRRGGGGSGTDFVCTWVQFHRHEQSGDGPKDECVFGPIEEVLCGEPGVAVPLHRRRDGLETRGSGAVVGCTAGSKTVKAARRDAGEPVERCTAYDHLSTDELVAQAALRCAYTVEGVPVAAAQQHVRAELAARLLPDGRSRLVPGKLKVAVACLMEEAVASAAHAAQDWVMLPGNVAWCPRAGCTRQRLPLRLLVAETRMGEWSAPAGYFLQTSCDGNVKFTTIDLKTWCRAAASQEWCGPLFDAATCVYFKTASDGSGDHSWQQEQPADDLGEEEVCIRELLWHVLLHGVVDLHPQTKGHGGAKHSVIYRQGGGIDTLQAQGSRNGERHLCVLCAVSWC
eukprot:TRINITY_DN409_c0_g1_i9.p1 TRINITY_DN409_c0_g1~~TRINITY_DN409_c0_g1_i9.p1  ORF type:complete len:645 (+),score=159.76 TRINITY_DN409_c0_g1_i9:122-1936(+)